MQKFIRDGKYSAVAQFYSGHCALYGMCQIKTPGSGGGNLTAREMEVVLVKLNLNYCYQLNTYFGRAVFLTGLEINFKQRGTSACNFDNSKSDFFRFRCNFQGIMYP